MSALSELADLNNSAFYLYFFFYFWSLKNIIMSLKRYKPFTEALALALYVNLCFKKHISLLSLILPVTTTLKIQN